MMTEFIIILLEYTQIMLIKNMLMQKKNAHFFYVILVSMSYGTRYLREEGDQNSEKIFYFQEKALEFTGLNFLKNCHFILISALWVIIGCIISVIFFYYSIVYSIISQFILKCIFFKGSLSFSSQGLPSLLIRNGSILRRLILFRIQNGNKFKNTMLSWLCNQIY